MALRTTTAAGAADSTPPKGLRNRWLQLCAGILGMVMIANLQYGWTLFVNPIDDAHHWGLTAIQVAFTIFVLFETWLVPVEGYLVDRFGPSVMVGIGGLLVAARLGSQRCRGLVANAVRGRCSRRSPREAEKSALRVRASPR